MSESSESKADVQFTATCVERLAVTDRSTCCGGGTSWTTAGARLAAEIAAIDLDQLDDLIADLVHGERRPRARGRPGRADRGRPPAPDRRRAGRAAARAGLGEDALAAGEVGVILVAGGSGTRLGFDGPKGTFPIGPVSSASLFQIHAEKIARALAPVRRMPCRCTS